MSKPRNVGLSWDQNGRNLSTAIRHPVYRWREHGSGFCGEREKLISDEKGKGASGDPRKAESTDALISGGPLRSSDEAE
jgi:hypothetical protein